MGVESVRRKTCLHRCNVPSTCLGIQEFFVSFCCLFWGLVKATQSNFPTRWSVDYHQRTSHTVFFVFSWQYAELVEKVPSNTCTPFPRVSRDWHLLTVALHLFLHTCARPGAPQKVGPRHPDTRLIVSTCTSGQQGPFSTTISTLLWPQRIEHCY